MQEIIYELGELRSQDRFQIPQDWEVRGVNPSQPEVIENLGDGTPVLYTAGKA